ncbi:MAG: hypothetical protein ACOC38_12490 [Promethearchaeia archaeon]
MIGIIITAFFIGLVVFSLFYTLRESTSSAKEGRREIGTDTSSERLRYSKADDNAFYDGASEDHVDALTKLKHRLGP